VGLPRLVVVAGRGGKRRISGMKPDIRIRRAYVYLDIKPGVVDIRLPSDM